MQCQSQGGRVRQKLTVQLFASVFQLMLEHLVLKNRQKSPSQQQQGGLGFWKPL